MFTLLILQAEVLRKIWSDSFLQIIGNFCALLLVLIAFSDDISNANPRYLKFVKNVIFKVLFVLLVFGISLWVNAQKDNNAKVDAAEKESIAQGKLDQRDSNNNKVIETLSTESQKVLVKSIDSVQKNVIDRTNEGLKLFHLHYDSVQNKVVRLVKDSTRRSTNVFKIAPPFVEVDTILVQKIANSYLRFNFKVSAKNDVAKEISIKFYGLRVSYGRYDRYDGPYSLLTLRQLNNSSILFPTDYPNPQPEDYQFFDVLYRVDFKDNFNKSYGYIDIVELNLKTLSLRKPSGGTFDFKLDEFNKAYPVTKNW